MRKRTKREKDAEDERSINNWCDLPQNFTSSLLYFLSPKSRCAFKATCKSWNEAKLLLPVPVGSPSSPCHSSPYLIRTDLDPSSSYECHHPITGECFHLTSDKSCRDRLERAKVHCSRFGWLLLSERISVSGRFFFFYDPFTKRKTDHGYLDSFPRKLFSALCFTSPPTSSDRQVLSGMLLEPRVGRFTVLIDGWLVPNCMPMVLADQHLSPHNSLVFHRGLYYCLVGAGVVGVSFIDNEKSNNHGYTFRDTKLFEPGTELRHSFLMEVDGRLLGMFDYQGIRVLWLDTDRFEWSPVGDEDLRDKILYVSYKGSIVQCDATTKGAGNKIYFPTIVNGGGVYYSLGTRKFHTPSCELEEIEDYGHSMTWIAPTTTNSL